MDTEEPKAEVTKNSTRAENILAYKELLSSTEVKECIESLLPKVANLFGQTKSTKLVNFSVNIMLMLSAFGSIGILAWFQLIPEGTTGVLAGIIIGYFFKRS